jgi:hypothetical protein
MKDFIIETVKDAFKLTAVLAVVTFIILFLTGNVHAEDSQWCGVVTEIYGVCSPELVQNYLAHVGIHATIRTPPQEIVAKLPGTEPEMGHISPPTSVLISPETPGALKPIKEDKPDMELLWVYIQNGTEPICWCSVINSLRCKAGDLIYEKESFNLGCQKKQQRLLQETEESTIWYKNKIWMVS